MKRRMKWLRGAVLALSLSLVMLFPVSASAAEGTDGTEMQVIQPEQLVIQLGADWAGVEFELKTDAGMYPVPSLWVKTVCCVWRSAGAAVIPSPA